MKISEVLLKYRCDKVLAHTYGDIYDLHFEPIRNDVRTVLEIGIEKGDAHFAWREAFPNAQIYGIDSEPHKAVNVERIKSFVCSTSNRDGLLKVIESLPPLDILIDDASHEIGEQLWVIAAFWHKIKPGGFMVVEDVAMKEFLHMFECFRTVIMYDLVSKKGKYDDMLVVIKR